jgi:hypothetical protein
MEENLTRSMFFFYLDPAKIYKSTVVPDGPSITVFLDPGTCYTNCISEQLVVPATVILNFPNLFFKDRQVCFLWGCDHIDGGFAPYYHYVLGNINNSFIH